MTPRDQAIQAVVELHRDFRLSYEQMVYAINVILKDSPGNLTDVVRKINSQLARP